MKINNSHILGNHFYDNWIILYIKKKLKPDLVFENGKKLRKLGWFFYFLPLIGTNSYHKKVKTTQH
jgi:hypothetical protein